MPERPHRPVAGIASEAAAAVRAAAVNPSNDPVSPAAGSARAAAHLAAIIDSSGDAIVSKNLDGVIQSWNPGAERLYGFTAAEILGRPMSILVPKDLLEEENLLIEKVRQGEHVEQFETVRVHKDGSAIEVSLTISPILGPDGKIIGISHFARDASETRELKEKLQIAEKMEALGRLAGGIAHDFNNLLTVITGYGVLLQTALKDDPQCSQMAHEVMAAAEDAAELTRQLLVFSRHQKVKIQPIDLNAEVLRLQPMLGRLIGEDVSLETRLAPHLGYILADPGQISQVLMNLSANARDAMPSGGKITIKTENWTVEDDRFHQQLGFAPGEYVRLLFTDTGQGMDAATRARIFEPFFTTKEHGKGTGFGLATAYGIVKQSGGQISVYSELGSGTTFAIYLPCVDCNEIPDRPGEAEVRHGHETILLVDDSPATRNLAESILRNHGYVVLTAGNADEALSVARLHTGVIDLLLTDFLMPGSNGGVLAAQLNEQRPEVRVVFMSGFSEHQILERVLPDAGAAFLQKPFTPAQLLRVMRAVLG